MTSPVAASAAPPPGPQRSWLARLLPPALRERLRPAAGLPWPVRVVYLARWLTGAPARPGPDRPVRRVVFVCHGNIIRSPLAEALCRREASAAGVALAAASAGLHAVPGRGADPRAADAAAALGVSLAAHSARPLSAEDVRLADLVLVMDYANDAEVAARFRWAWGKIRLLGSLAGAGPVIPDPYAQDAAAVRAAAARIAEAVRALVRSVGGGR